MAGQYEQVGVVDAYGISPAEDVAEFTTFTGGVDLTTQSGYPQRPARKIVVISKGAGTVLAVTPVRGTARSLTVVNDGEELTMATTNIGATTNVARVRVFW